MRFSIVFSLLTLLSAQLLAQTEQEDAKKSDAAIQAAQRLEYMKNSLKVYEFLVAPDFQSKLTVEPDALLRFTNPVSGLQDGGFFVWKDDTGRPMVGAQVFLTADNLWIHEFQSLAPVPFRVTRGGKVTWEPNRAGVEMKSFPDAPVPANTPVKRLVQMRELAGRFTASDEFEGRPRSDELRLLTKPLVRFGREGTETLDGALFVHAHGTDPELMILLEARQADAGDQWYYGLAPMTGYALKASLGEKPVWEVGWRKAPFSPQEPFFLLVHSRESALRRILDSTKKSQ